VAQVATSNVEVIVVAASEGYELAAAELLASVGIEVRGFLAGGMTAWRADGRPVSRLEMIDVDDLASRLGTEGEVVVVDVRDADEFEREHIPGSLHIPYAELRERLGELPRDRAIATICSGGKRSGLAASILQREGFEHLIHVNPGGVASWRERGHTVDSGR
jgi:hydroxyacylglutathione hydrolase